MHYRNGREAKNGDKIVMLDSMGNLLHFGALTGAVPGNDHCNGSIAPLATHVSFACLCDCLHVEDIAEMLKERGLHARPAGK